jgi:hypothetical protein
MNINELSKEDKMKLSSLVGTMIENEEEYALDVAANLGQSFNNIKGMSWFKYAIAQELLDDGWVPNLAPEEEVNLINQDSFQTPDGKIHR